MEINALNNLAASMADMGQMLRQVTEAKLALDDKMLGAAIAEGEQAAGTAAGIDTYAWIGNTPAAGFPLLTAMENDTLYGFRIRMAVFAQVVNEMIVEQLEEEGQAGAYEAQPQTNYQIAESEQ